MRKQILISIIVFIRIPPSSFRMKHQHIRHALAQLDEAPRCQPEGREFVSRW